MAAMILVTNDDGISASGMWRLAEGLRQVGDHGPAGPAP